MSARVEREKTLRYLVVGSGGNVNRAHPNAVEYELLVDLRLTYEELRRQQEMWRLQSRIISALARELPDDLRSRVLAPFVSEDATRPTPAPKVVGGTGIHSPSEVGAVLRQDATRPTGDKQ